MLHHFNYNYWFYKIRELAPSADLIAIQNKCDITSIQPIQPESFIKNKLLNSFHLSIKDANNKNSYALTSGIKISNFIMCRL